MKLKIDYTQNTFSWMPGKCLFPSRGSGEVEIDSDKVYLTPTPTPRPTADMPHPYVNSSQMMNSLKGGLSGYEPGDAHLLNTFIKNPALAAVFNNHEWIKYSFIFFPEAVNSIDNPIYTKGRDGYTTLNGKRILVEGKTSTQQAFDKYVFGLRRTKGATLSLLVSYGFQIQRQNENIGCFGEECAWVFLKS